MPPCPSPQHVANHTGDHACGGMPIVVVVMSLLTPERAQWVEELRTAMPDLVVMRSVSGYNQTEARLALRRAGLRFHALCKQWERWGNVATHASRFLAFEWQSRCRVPYMALLEDDLRLRPAFKATGRLHDWLRRTACGHLRRCGERCAAATPSRAKC